MNAFERQMFRHFIFGRVNEYYMFKEYRLKAGQNYKEFRINMAADYLKFGEKNQQLVHSLLKSFYYLETIVSIILIAFRFIEGSIRWVFTKHQILKNEKVILNVPFQKIKKLFKDANIPTESIVVVESPYLESDLFSYGFGKRVNLFSGLIYRDIWRSFLMSIRMSFFIKRKYGKRDCFFRAYSSFDYFLSYFYFLRLDNSNTVFFPSINDRWTYLFGHIQNKTVFLQHGGLNRNKVLYILSKVGKADDAFYINEIQRNICNKFMFTNTPKAHYFAKMMFTSNEKLLNNGNKDVLLACELIYYETEVKIIKELSLKPNLNLYVKPHPQNSIVKYTKLNETYDFVLLGKTDFPKMDYVISYDSTLVLEYQSNGVKTLMYEDPDFETQYQRLLDI